jgi:hypothetical protein
MRREQHHARVECPEVERWTAPDVLASEDEVARFLAGMVDLLKPDLVVETGAYLGHTSAAIGRALLAVERGRLVALERDPQRAAEARVRTAGLPVTVETTDTLTWTPPSPIDLLFLDTELATRPAELRRFAPWASPRSVVVVHDTHDAALRTALQACTEDGLTGGWTFYPTPRGIGTARLIARQETSTTVPLHASPGTVAYLGRWNLPFFFAGQIVGLDVPPGSAKVAIEGTDVAQSRNKAVQRMLEFPGHRWLLFVDDDMLFEDDAVMRLLRHDRPVVSGLTFARRAPYVPCVYPITAEQMASGDLVEVEEAGTGFLLIRREVLEAIPAPWFEAGRIETGELREDKHFCQKVRAAGFPIAVDTSLRIGHQMDAWVRPGPNGQPQIVTL